MPPTATSEKALPMRSSSIFGSAIVTVLNTSPAAVPIRMNSPNTAAMHPKRKPHVGRGAALGGLWRSSGTIAR